MKYGIICNLNGSSIRKDEYTACRRHQRRLDDISAFQDADGEVGKTERLQHLLEKNCL